MKKIYSSILFFSLILLILSACSQNQRPIVPYEIDSDEVFKALEPNEEDFPENLTFGKNNIPGFIFDNDFTTGDHDIFIYIQNLTLLNINPKINQNIFDFIHQQLNEGGFINDSIKIDMNEFIRLQNSGLSYLDAAAKILDEIDNNFQTQSDKLSAYNSPFNIYFQIYPIYLTEDYITYRLYCYSYTGGAHGITTSYLKSFNLQNGSELSLEEIIKPEGIPQIHEEVAAHMAYSYPIYENIQTVNEYVDSLNVWLGNFYGEEENSEHDNQITLFNFPLPNPALLGEGIAFIYQMYTIAPGSDGCPLVVIPYSEIKGYLYPQFSK